MSYTNSIKPSEMSLIELISFLNFLPKCKICPPKAFLKEMWNLLFQEKEDTSSSMLAEICTLLYYVDSSEVDKDDLQKFVQLCVEKRLWAPVACLLCAGVKKAPFIVCLLETVASHLEDVGFCYEELAKEIYDSDGSVPIQENSTFVQLGVCLLMEASSKKYYDSAFKVLLVFHRYNINYLDYQAPMYSAVSYIKSVPDPSKIFIFPFSVAFTALEICLHLERPKDAYTIFQKLSLNLPKEFDEAFKLEINIRRFQYLLKITLALQPKDPLVSGIKALRSLLVTAQTDFTLEQLNDYSKDIQTTYNEYMVSILNAQEEDLIKEFYSYIYGPQKELFTLDGQVLRGLTVFFVKHAMLVEANKLYLLGYSKHIYKKPAVKKPPWEMTVKSNWTVEEIKLTFLRFMETLTPFLELRNKTEGFDEWYSVKISIKKVAKMVYNVDCLNECSTILERVGSALKGLDSTLRWKFGEGENSVHLIPETFYKFWFSKSPSQPTKIFMVPGKVRISFGKSCSRDGSDSECPKQFSDLGSSEGVDKCLASATYHAVDTRSDENVHSEDSTCMTVPAVSHNNFRNNRNSNKMLVQDNISKNIARFSPQRTISSCSSARGDISPNNGVNMKMFDQYNASNLSGSPRKSISSHSPTPPRIQNHILSGNTATQKSASTSPSPQRSSYVDAGTYINPGKSISSHSPTPPRIQNHIPYGSVTTPKSPSTSPSPQKSSYVNAGTYVNPRKSFSSHSPTPPRIQNRILSGNTFIPKSPSTSPSPQKTSYVNPRKSISSNSSTPPRIPNCILSGNITASKSVSTTPSPQKSFLKSANRIVSPHVQEKFSPRTTINISSGMTVSSTTFDDADQNCSLRKDLNFDDGEISTQTSTTTSTLPEPKLKNSVPETSPGTNLNRNIKTLKPKTILKSIKKTTLTKKRHLANCLKLKKNCSTILKPKLNILKMAPMKITLQNTTVQGEELRIVKPVCGVEPIKASQPEAVDFQEQTEVMDFQESSFQCNVPQDVFLRITTFLKTRVKVKRRDLTPGQQQHKALSLAHSFIQSNAVTALDKRTMKLLNVYSDQCL